MKRQNQIPLYNGVPIGYSTTPINISKKTYSFIESSLTKVLKQVEDFTTQSLKEKKIMAQLGLPTDIDATPTPLGLHIPFARFDFIFDLKQNIQILELNTDGTSGWNIVDWLGEVSGLKPEENPNYNLSMRLLEGLRAHAPNASIVYLLDFPEVMTSWEQNNLIERWNEIMPTQRSDPKIKSWDEGALIYRRAVSWQLRERASEAKAFLEDWHNKKIKVIGGWSSDVGMSKAWPALMHHPLFPETLLINNKTKPLLKDKDLWILKKKFSHSGQGVLRGKDVSQNVWEEKLKDENNFIAQKMVNLPLFDGKQIEFGMFFINGKSAGCMVRTGHSGVITDTSEDILIPLKISN